MDLGIGGIIKTIGESEYNHWFYFGEAWSDPNNFFKQFFSGALIALVMTGMDQDMMQKNMSCKNIGEARKNIYTMSSLLVVVNMLFLSLGALLYIFAAHIGLEIPARSDLLYPVIALNHLPSIVGIVFIVGITASAYSSVDSALTGLTTSFCIDFLNFKQRDGSEGSLKRMRTIVHVGFSVLLFLSILAFHAINSDAVINGLFKAAGYTYGPLLGLFAFGLLTKRKIIDRMTLWVAIAAPLLSYIIDINSREWLNGFTFGFFILALNGALTFLGLLIFSEKEVVR